MLKENCNILFNKTYFNEKKKKLREIPVQYAPPAVVPFLQHFPMLFLGQ